MEQTNSTQEYLRNYIVNRCYDEIVIALPIDVNAMFNKLFAQEISKTRDYRLRILENELIAIQQDRLKQMEQEKIEKEIVFFITVFIPVNRVDTNNYDGRISAALAFSNDSIESSANIAIVASLRSM